MTASTAVPFEVLTLGRVGVDLYPLRSGVPLEQVDTFARSLGGSATNVAVAAARHGRRSAVITRTGADPFGRFVHQALDALGVDDRYVRAVAALPTPVVFCELFPPDDFPLYFYRQPSAPDLQVRPDELDLEAVARAGVFWTTLSGLCAQPSRSAHSSAWQARGRSPLTVLDLDYRPSFWPDEATATAAAREAVEHASVVVGNQQECRVALGLPAGDAHADEPDAVAQALLDAGVQLAVVKRGPHGALARTGSERVVVPSYPVEVVNGLGAGDAFGGALCHGLLAGWPLERVLRFASAAGAVVAGRLACAEAMPTTAEVEAVLTSTMVG